MSDDGGPATPPKRPTIAELEKMVDQGTAFDISPSGDVSRERIMEDGGADEQAKLRERFAVALAGNPSMLKDGLAAFALNEEASASKYLAEIIMAMAQKLTDEAMKQRGEDATKLQRLQAENAKMKARIAEFIDGERCGEPEPRPGDE